MEAGRAKLEVASENTPIRCQGVWTILSGISPLAERLNSAMIVLPMGATGPMRLGLAHLEAAER